MKSLAMALAAKEASQRKVAGRLGVALSTVQDWVTDFGGRAETGHADLGAMPSDDELLAIADEIDAGALEDVLPQVRNY